MAQFTSVGPEAIATVADLTVRDLQERVARLAQERGRYVDALAVCADIYRRSDGTCRPVPSTQVAATECDLYVMARCGLIKMARRQGVTTFAPLDDSGLRAWDAA